MHILHTGVYVHSIVSCFGPIYPTNIFRHSVLILHPRATLILSHVPLALSTEAALFAAFIKTAVTNIFLHNYFSATFLEGKFTEQRKLAFFFKSFVCFGQLESGAPS